MNEPYPIDGSRDALWMETAPPAPHTSILTDSQSADVAIIGAGLTGLNAALLLAQQGVDVAVLESATIGFGASGRAGGQVNLGLNAAPAALLKQFGQEQGERTIDMVMNTPQTVFNLIAEHGLKCDPVQNGWVQAAVSQRVADYQKSMADDYNQHAPVFELLDQGEVSERTGAQGYVGGLFCGVAGSVQPLSYTRELARVVLSHGVRIFSSSRVTGLGSTTEGWQLSTASGQLKAKTVLVCTNGYTQEGTGKPLEGLSRKLVPVRSILVATEPLSDNLKKTILPEQVTFVDKRRLILYARYDKDGRLCIGDHGPMRDAFAPSDFDSVKQRAVAVFPQLAGVKWDYHWGGRVAMTQSGLPFLHEVAPGLIAGMGFNGRGVGAGTMMGRELAQYAMHRQPDALGFPISEPKSFAMHRFHGAGVSMSVKWYALLDYLESVR